MRESPGIDLNAGSPSNDSFRACPEAMTERPDVRAERTESGFLGSSGHVSSKKFL